MKIQQHIQQLTGLTDIAYGKIVLETGMSYLAYETFYHEDYMQALSYTPEYWEFWKKVVESRSKLFIEQFAKSSLTRRELEYIFEALLDIRSLSIYPPDFNWADGYNDYINKLISNYHKKQTACV